MSADPFLSEILAERERRGERRAELSAESGLTVVQLTIAAPGRRKNGEDIGTAARFGAALLERRLAERGLGVLRSEARDGAAGPCYLWVVDADAGLVKSIAVGLEDGYFLGRLWDIDVYGSGGSKLDREALGKAARKCFVCGSPAAICAGRRLHELADVELRFKEILDRGIEEMEEKGESL